MHGAGPELARLGAVPVAVGFSPAEALAPLADHLAWTHRFLADPERTLYARLGLGRARVRDAYNRATLHIYGEARRRGAAVNLPVEDTLQLGADVVVREGRAVAVFRPRSPDDRPDVDSLLGAVATAAPSR